MTYIRLVTITSVLMFALTTIAVARQPANRSDAHVENSQHQSGAENGVPTVEEQLQLFTTRLDLTSDQQARIKPILVELHQATVRLVNDKSLTHDDRKSQVWAWRLKTDKRIRELLSEEQKTKLDQVENESHPELHGDVDSWL